jgi:nicotinic acid mononucleotide adenylyltransferase
MTLPQRHKDYSLQDLADYSQELINKNLDQEESARTSVCLAVAGGGGHAISTLASTPGASSMLLEGTVTYDRKSYLAYVNLPSNTSDFRYSSSKAAKLASEAALKRALIFRSSNLRLMNGCVGIGCASALVSSSSPDSVKGYGHIVATRADGFQLTLNVTLAGKEDDQCRTRVEEDIFISHLVLRAIERVQQVDDGVPSENDFKTYAGDAIVEQWQAPNGVNGDQEKDAAIAASNRILAGDAHAVVLLPIYKDGIPTSFRALDCPVVPNGSLVFPGSFNPPHDGHITLAQAAIKAAMHNMSKVTTYRKQPPIFMELSLTNADKPAIDPAIVSERVHRFLQLGNLPDQWGILLTRAPLFAQKVACLNDCIVDQSEGAFPKMSFVIGTDTLVRIINPKYYGNEESAMLEAIRSMKGVHFVVGGRLEQTKGSSSPPKFVAGGDEVFSLPKDVQEMFTIIQESDFRKDISSSEIREQQEAMPNGRTN